MRKKAPRECLSPGPSEQYAISHEQRCGMKKQAFTPYLPSWEYIPDGEPRIFGTGALAFHSFQLAKGE